MSRRNMRASRRTFTGTIGSGRASLERRVRDALADAVPPSDMVERVMAAVVAGQSTQKAERPRRLLWGLAPAALTACVATLATLLFLMVADTCLAVGPEQAALAQRLAFATTMLRFRLAEFANALLRLFGALLP